MIELKKQREQLLKQNNSNFTEFETKLKERFIRSMQFTDEIKQWKEEVSNLCWNYDSQTPKLKSIFEIMDIEKKKNLCSTGKEFQTQIDSVTGHVDNIMKGYLSSYKIEYKTALNTEYLQIYNPKMDLESVIFNTKIDVNPPSQFSENKKKSKSFINMPDSFEFDFKASVKKTNEQEVFSSDDEFAENERDLENDIVEQDLLNALNKDKAKEESKVTVKPKVIKRNNSNFLGANTKNFIGTGNSPVTLHSMQKILPYQPSLIQKPTSNRQILGSPKVPQKRNTLCYQLYKSENKPLGALRKSSQNIGMFREKSNPKQEAREKSMKNKIKKRNSAFQPVTKRKSQIGMNQVEKQGNLKKLLLGKHAKKLMLLTKDSLNCLDLNFGGKLIRNKGF